MLSGWLIRFENGNALIWKRKFFLGMIAIPWALHGGTNIIRTQDANEDVLLAAFEYVSSQEKKADITVKL